MNNLGSKKILAILAIAVVLIALPIIILQTQKSQDVRQRAAGVPTGTGDTKIYLSPNTGYQVGRNANFNVELKLNANNKSVANLTVELIYDSGKFTYNSSGFQKGSQFDSVIANPNVSASHIRILAESNPTTPINANDVLVATLSFTSKGETGNGTISFADSPLSVFGKSVTGSIISLTTEAPNVTYTIAASPSNPPAPNATATTAPGGATITVTATPTFTATPTQPPADPCSDATGKANSCACTENSQCASNTCGTATPKVCVENPSDMGIKFRVTLPGIGQESGENTNPVRNSRAAKVTLYNATDNVVVLDNQTFNLVYDSGDGTYAGYLPLPSSFNAGNYTAKIKVDNSLYKTVPGVLAVTSPTGRIVATPVKLVTGDLNGDNYLGTIDWTSMIACIKNEAACTANIRALADLNDNGGVDELDVQILQRGFAIIEGD